MAALPKILRHSSDDEPGISRRRRGKGFSYHAPDGDLITRDAVLERIKGLGLPPAYEEVWICTDAFGHIQATGRDDKGRKQYRYHNDWRAYRDRLKFDRLSDFGRNLPKLRAKVERDLRREDTDLRFVCAALTRLIDRGALRIGSRAYAGDSFGATTLRAKHIKLNDGGLCLDYTAKGGKRVRKTIRDSSLSRTLERIDDLPGRALFQYVDGAGEVRRVDSADVNAYLGEDFTAKTFRTWHGTVAAFDAARKSIDSGKAPTIKALSERAAERLHNTASICRSSYIHPDVINLAETSLEETQSRLSSLQAEPIRGLKRAETACLKLISS